MQSESPVIITILALYALLSHLQNEKRRHPEGHVFHFFPIVLQWIFFQAPKQCKNYL